jgi:hypothetical protein
MLHCSGLLCWLFASVYQTTGFWFLSTTPEECKDEFCQLQGFGGSLLVFDWEQLDEPQLTIISTPTCFCPCQR